MKPWVLSPYIDSGVNHKQHFIKIPFIYTAMEFIDLQSIFKVNILIFWKFILIKNKFLSNY